MNDLLISQLIEVRDTGTNVYNQKEAQAKAYELGLNDLVSFIATKGSNGYGDLMREAAMRQWKAV